MMQHRKTKHSPLGWFLLGIFPILNLPFLWKCAKLIAEHEEV
jgi:hypothetical protein